VLLCVYVLSVFGFVPLVLSLSVAGFVKVVESDFTLVDFDVGVIVYGDVPGDDVVDVPGVRSK